MLGEKLEAKLDSANWKRIHAMLVFNCRHCWWYSGNGRSWTRRLGRLQRARLKKRQTDAPHTYPTYNRAVSKITYNYYMFDDSYRSKTQGDRTLSKSVQDILTNLKHVQLPRSLLTEILLALSIIRDNIATQGDKCEWNGRDTVRGLPD